VSLALGSFTVAYLVVRRRHHCVHNDPLCRKDKPCIACYREIFRGSGQ
jgi:hypothetical protein